MRIVLSPQTQEIRPAEAGFAHEYGGFYQPTQGSGQAGKMAGNGAVTRLTFGLRRAGQRMKSSIHDGETVLALHQYGEVGFAVAVDSP